MERGEGDGEGEGEGEREEGERRERIPAWILLIGDCQSGPC